MHLSATARLLMHLVENRTRIWVPDPDHPDNLVALSDLSDDAMHRHLFGFQLTYHTEGVIPAPIPNTSPSNPSLIPSPMIPGPAEWLPWVWHFPSPITSAPKLLDRHKNFPRAQHARLHTRAHVRVRRRKRDKRDRTD